MPPARKDFSLCETVAGALHAVSEAYGMDGCWLPWQFEKHVLTEGATPFRITTKEYPRDLKEGVDKVCFEVAYDNDNPNLLKFIRFDELPSKGKYIVSQTSMKHVKDDAGVNCALWIEIPKDADREGIAGAKSLFKAKVCCAVWKDHLPPSPETAIERAHLCLVQDDVEWLKGQVTFKDSANVRLSSALAFSKIEITALKARIATLEDELAKTGSFNQRIHELKAEVKVETQAKDAAVGELQAKLKILSKNVDKLQATLKQRTNINKLRRDLKANGKMAEESGSESPTPATVKRKRIPAPTTPKGKIQGTEKVPNTAPGMYGSSSTLHSTPASQNPTLNPAGTMGAARTPLARAPRLQNAAFSFDNTAVLGRTRAATAAFYSVGHTPPANTYTSQSPWATTVSSSIDSVEDPFTN